MGILAFFNMQLLSSSVGIEDKKMVGSDSWVSECWNKIYIEYAGDMISDTVTDIQRQEVIKHMIFCIAEQLVKAIGES